MDGGPSFASLLVRKSQAMNYGHGWIAAENGKRWHPARDQSELLSGLSAKPVKPTAFLIFRIARFLIKGATNGFNTK